MPASVRELTYLYTLAVRSSRSIGHRRPPSITPGSARSSPVVPLCGPLFLRPRRSHHQVFCGHPPFRFPFGFQVRACLVIFKENSLICLSVCLSFRHKACIEIKKLFSEWKNELASPVCYSHFCVETAFLLLLLLLFFSVFLSFFFCFVLFEKIHFCLFVRELTLDESRVNLYNSKTLRAHHVAGRSKPWIHCKLIDLLSV